MTRLVWILPLAAVGVLLALIAATVASDDLFSPPEYPPDKQALIDRNEREYREALRSPRPTSEGYCPPPTPEFTATPVRPFLEQTTQDIFGIQRLRSHWLDYLDGVQYVVLTGASNLDPQQGAIFVYTKLERGRRADQGGVVPPHGTGAIRIESVTDFVFQLSSENGTRFVFDLRSLTLSTPGGRPVAATVYPIVTIQPEPTPLWTREPCRRTVVPDRTPTPTSASSSTPTPEASVSGPQLDLAVTDNGTSLTVTLNVSGAVPNPYKGAQITFSMPGGLLQFGGGSAGGALAGALCVGGVTPDTPVPGRTEVNFGCSLSGGKTVSGTGTLLSVTLNEIGNGCADIVMDSVLGGTTTSDSSGAQANTYGVTTAQVATVGVGGVCSP